MSERLFSYIVTHDTGFSPNPFWNYCTLANCKPAIRRTAVKDDWIIGLSPKVKGNRIIYAMRISERLSYSEYFFDNRFALKTPDLLRNEHIYKCGDRIYEPINYTGFNQLKNPSHDDSHKTHDLKGCNVLISEDFVYFGSESISLPPELEIIIGGRGHKCKFHHETVKKFIQFINMQPRGILAKPSK